MPSYKKDNGKWYCSFYYTDYTGLRKKKKKEGFTTKKEADNFEREFLTRYSGQPTISFETLCNIFIQDYEHRVRQTTYNHFLDILNAYIMPYFKEFKQITDIKPLTVRNFQNHLSRKEVAESTNNYIIFKLSQILKFAVDYYGLTSNPCSAVKKLKSNKKEFNILTEHDFKKFIELVPEQEKIFFILLFYTGLRFGEALALTWGDFKGNKLSINKTLVMVDGQEEYNEPKTKKSKRIVVLPAFLVDMLNEYKKTMYKPLAHHNMFLKKRSYYVEVLKKARKKMGINLRMHDFRHSHISLLIHMGVNPVAIAERVGHESASITLSVYGHLYSEDKEKVAELLKF